MSKTNKRGKERKGDEKRELMEKKLVDKVVEREVKC